MLERFWMQRLDSFSDNRKSKACTEPSRSIKNRKLAGILAVVVTIALSGVVAQAQQTGKIFRIGFLDSSTASRMALLVDAFRQELRKLGWIEGKNFNIEYRFAEGKPERAPDLAAELVRLKVDLIVTTAAPQALAAKGATTTIPIVMVNVGDPVAFGLVASLARPGGNVTGNASLAPDLNTKRLEISRTRSPSSPELDFCWRREPA